MNRRDFTKMAIAGIGMAAVPGLTARAFAEALGDVMGGPPPSVSTSTYLPLLERARAALDRHHSHFALRDRVALADFSIASRNMRFHIVDLISGQSWSYLVAHGKGSDPEHSGFLQRFSNEYGSLATSEGAYKTGEIYDGVHGKAMRLVGLDDGNTNAEARAIVIHGADYVSENHIASWGKCGRSEGCFAVAPHMLSAVLGLLGPDRMLFADKLNA
jgi:hypothetical protein